MSDIKHFGIRVTPLFEKRREQIRILVRLFLKKENEAFEAELKKLEESEGLIGRSLGIDIREALRLKLQHEESF